MFAPKYHRKIFYDSKRIEIGKISDINIEEEAFGVEDTTLTHQERTQSESKYKLKEDKEAERLAMELKDPFRTK